MTLFRFSYKSPSRRTLSYRSFYAGSFDEALKLAPKQIIESGRTLFLYGPA